MLETMRSIAAGFRNAPTRVVMLGALLALAPGGVAGQGAVDPNVAPRAAELNRQGERGLGIEMLGRYLAVAQSDGRAWFLLSKFYRMDAADWHRAGHHGDPSADVYLSLASVAVDEATRLHVDSAPLYRALVSLDRALLVLEDAGWDALRVGGLLPPLPPIVGELGRNLATSCPMNGVLITGSEIEWLAAWSGTMGPGGRGDLVPLRVDLYLTDSLYRDRMAALLDVPPDQPLSAALLSVAVRRPLCLAPSVGTVGMPELAWSAARLVRVGGTTAPLAPERPLSLVDLLLDVRNGGSVWTPDVLNIYASAARTNATLCRSLSPLAGTLPPDTCEQ